MRILMLNFTRRWEGTYFRALPWARHLAGRGHEVTLASCSPTRSLRIREEHDEGVRILQTSNFLDGNLFMKRFSGLDGWGPLDLMQRCRALRTGGYDVVHTFEHHPNVAAPVFRYRRRLPFVHVADGCDHYGSGGFREEEYRPYRLHAVYRRAGAPLRAWMDRIERNLRTQSDAVTVISSFLRDRARSFGIPEDQIHLIPGSADCDRIKPVARDEARKRIGLDTSGPVAAFFGAGQFDVDLLLTALTLLRGRIPDLLLLLIGRVQPWVGERAVHGGLESRVRQTGWCPDAELPFYLGAADVFLLPMKDNPVNRARWPNKIGAYMAAGRPTVCADVGDVGALVRDHAIGVVCSPEARSFADSIERVLSNEAEAGKMGSRARRLAETAFAPQVQGAQIERLYTRLTSRPPACGQVGSRSPEGRRP